MKIFAEVCVLKPKDITAVVETLINNKCSVVIRANANAYGEGDTTILMVGYGEIDTDDAGYDLRDHFESMLEGTGGDVTESGEGHQDTYDAVAPPFGLQFAIDVFDDQRGIAHRISCAEYSLVRAIQMMGEAAGLLCDGGTGSSGAELAHRLLMAGVDDACSEAA